MLLDNTLPLASALYVSPVSESDVRVGLLVAKATFRMRDGGRLELDTDGPWPIFVDEHLTASGLVPEDTLPRDGESLEVLFLGSAHAPSGVPVEEMRVAMTVGAHRQELDVIGDRRWVDGPDGPVIGPAAPFLRSSLGWDRAFGGTEWVEVDADSFMDVGHPTNPMGMGFDANGQAARLRQGLGAPTGLAAVKPRRLPNLEDPSHRIRNATDQPTPSCWAPLSVEHPMHVARSFQELPDIASMLAHGDVPRLPRYHYRAVDRWIIPRTSGDISLCLEGLTPLGRETFVVPDLDLAFDFEIGEVRGSRSVPAHVWVVLPDERTLTVTYRLRFNMAVETGQRRGARLRAWGLSKKETAR